jgi:site-specific recombinase XerD
MGISSAQTIYYRAVKKSGVRRKGGIHVLRHSFATHRIESGVELTLVQRLMCSVRQKFLRAADERSSFH